ncbi:MAG: antibiotic biosynthesis monooxygenase [Nitrospira sp.]|nr:antibiotic biosynthesis monooxygenase [Nitrospira sp.]
MLTKKTLVLSFFALMLSPFDALGQDPVPLYPENYKVLLENDRVRVLDFQLKKGAKESTHSHPTHVVYVLSPFKIRFTFPGGQTGIRETRAGEALFSEPVTHASENIGDTDAHGILVELKTPLAGEATGQRTPEDEWLTAVTFIQGVEGKEEELKRELLSLEAPTRAEPGNITYDLYQSPEKKNEFMRFEVWRNPKALEAHKATPHIKASFERRQKQGPVGSVSPA